MLNKLKGKGLKYKIERYFFGHTEMEYLSLWLTRDGIKPINRKIEAITNIKPPTSRQEVRKFIGVINYYHDMLPRCSHTLVPLTRLTYNKRKFNWTQVEQDAFDKIKLIMARDTLLTYP